MSNAIVDQVDVIVPADEIARRTIRRSDWVPCNSAFIDCRTPGSDRKENYLSLIHI